MSFWSQHGAVLLPSLRRYRREGRKAWPCWKLSFLPVMDWQSIRKINEYYIPKAKKGAVAAGVILGNNIYNGTRRPYKQQVVRSKQQACGSYVRVRIPNPKAMLRTNEHECQQAVIRYSTGTAYGVNIICLSMQWRATEMPMGDPVFTLTLDQRYVPTNVPTYARTNYGV